MNATGIGKFDHARRRLQAVPALRRGAYQSLLRGVVTIRVILGVVLHGPFLNVLADELKFRLLGSRNTIADSLFAPQAKFHGI
jgi:hypothetical protein